VILYIYAFVVSVTTAIIRSPVTALVIEVRDVKAIVGVEKAFLYFELILKG